jgi:hypothetical protein
MVGVISSEVQRTLVKSPPELWAELSDPTSLARHLGELGEIRITRVEAELLVEWEAEDASGTVLIKPSGWGTKVKLTAMRGTAEPPSGATVEPAVEPAAPPAQLTAGSGAEPLPPEPREPEPVSPAEAELQLVPAPEPAREPEPETAPEPEPTLDRRPSFFARLFGRSRRGQAEAHVQPVAAPETAAAQPPPDAASESPQDMSTHPRDAFAALQDALSMEAFAAANPFAMAATMESSPETEKVASRDDAAAAPDEVATRRDRQIAEELKAAEEVTSEEVTAVLTAVLDRLGAAHHRPFSRS